MYIPSESSWYIPSYLCTFLVSLVGQCAETCKFSTWFVFCCAGQFPLYSYTSTLVRSVLDNFTALLSSLWPYAVVAVLFVVFVIWNGSVVVGDKSHHQASLHIPQVFYFATFACFFACGQLILNWRIAFSFVKQLCQPQWMLGLCVLALCGYLAVKHFT